MFIDNIYIISISNILKINLLINYILVVTYDITYISYFQNII